MGQITTTKTVCSTCLKETCDGRGWKCLGCGGTMCTDEYENEWARYGKPWMKKPNEHLYVQGHGAMWECGPVEPLTETNKDIPGSDPRSKY